MITNASKCITTAENYSHGLDNLKRQDSLISFCRKDIFNPYRSVIFVIKSNLLAKYAALAMMGITRVYC
jgi:hypothetical protein